MNQTERVTIAQSPETWRLAARFDAFRRQVELALVGLMFADVQRARRGATVCGLEPADFSGDDTRAIAVAVLRRLSDIGPEPVRWLWPQRFALGKLSLIAGDPGLGKSFLTVDMAARVSTGSPWPDGTPCERSNVILVSAEDDLADTIRPRLDAHRADTKRVVALECVQRRRAVTQAPIDEYGLPTRPTTTSREWAVQQAMEPQRLDSLAEMAGIGGSE